MPIILLDVIMLVCQNIHSHGKVSYTLLKILCLEGGAQRDQVPQRKMRGLCS